MKPADLVLQKANITNRSLKKMSFYELNRKLNRYIVCDVKLNLYEPKKTAAFKQNKNITLNGNI